MKDSSRRINRGIVVDMIVKALLDKGAHRYVILKKKIESGPYLNGTNRKIPWDTWESIIKELERAKIIVDRPPKSKNGVSRRTDFYLLTLREEVKEDARRRLTLGLPIIGKNERLEKLYQLILYYDAEHHIGFKIPENDDELLRKLSLIGLKSLDDLVIDSERGVDNNRVVATYYKSVSPCMEIRKRTIQTSLPWASQKPDCLSPLKAVHYYFTFLGVSKKEILDSNNSRRYIFDDIVFSNEEVEKAFDALLRLKIIKPLGTLDGIVRYSSEDEQLHDYVCSCFNIRSLLVEIIDRKFLSDKRHSTRRILTQSIRDWIELFRSSKYVDNMFDFLKYYGKNEADDGLFTSLEAVRYLYSFIDKQIERITIDYKEVFERYGCLAESLLEIARSESLKKAIDDSGMAVNNLCTISKSINNMIKASLSNNMNLDDAYEILKHYGIPQNCYNTIIRNTGFVIQFEWKNSKSVFFITKPRKTR